MNNNGGLTDLPEDILFRVLDRLPKLSERRLRAVSKTWRDLIIKAASSSAAPFRYLDSGFVVHECLSNHMRLYRLDNKGGLTRQDSLLPPLKDRETFIAMMGSSNGVLFFCTLFYDDRSNSTHNFYLYNPLTGQISTLPRHSSRSLSGSDSRPGLLGLALDSKSSTGHFKLVAVYRRSIYSRNFPSVSIFDSETGEWETRPAKFRPNLRNMAASFSGVADYSVCVDGVIYWLDKEERDRLVAFFLEDEIFRVLKLPHARNNVIEDAKSRTGVQQTVIWESEEGLKYGEIRQREGLCIWVLDHPHDQLIGVKDDQHDHCDNIAGCSSHQYNNGWKLAFRISPKTLIEKVISPVIMTKCFDDHVIRGVSAFNEELYIVHILTSEGYVSYNIPENTVSLLPHDYLEKAYLPELPFTFTYRSFELPECVGSGENRRRKRKIQNEEQQVAGPPRRSNRIISKLRATTDDDHAA